MECQPVQQRLQELLDQLVLDGGERGLQVAAYLDGKLVVDAWAGVADAASGRLVDGETLFPVFSSTKGLATTIAHRLVERNKLDYDMPIAKVWPAFGVRGKEHITLRQALTHSAGVPQMPAGIDYRPCAIGTRCARPLPICHRSGQRGRGSNTTR